MFKGYTKKNVLSDKSLQKGLRLLRSVQGIHVWWEKREINTKWVEAR